MNSTSSTKHALIVGAGLGISLSFANKLAQHSYHVTLVARAPGSDLTSAARAIGAQIVAADATDAAAVAALFEQLDAENRSPEIVLYNAGFRAAGALVDLAPGDVRQALAVGAFGAFLVCQQAARRMLRQGRGCLLLTGASASVKGYPRSAPFAMAKFALRGLAQSMARELAPLGIHVAHVVIDGGVRSSGRPSPAGSPDTMLDPDAIAEAYWQLSQQPRSAWAWEIELRPWQEKF